MGFDENNNQNSADDALGAGSSSLNAAFNASRAKKALDRKKGDQSQAFADNAKMVNDLNNNVFSPDNTVNTGGFMGGAPKQSPAAPASGATASAESGAVKAGAEAGSSAAGSAAAEGAGATTAEAASASTGAGAVVAVALEAVKQTLNAAASLADPTGTSEKGASRTVMGVAILLLLPFFLFSLFLSVLIGRVTPGPAESHQESQYGEEHEYIAVNTETFTENYGNAMEPINEDTLKDGLLKYIGESYESDQSFKKALYTAITSDCLDIIEELDFTWIEHIMDWCTYDEDRSLETFFENPFPYDLQEGGFPKIGNICTHAGSSKAAEFGYESMEPQLDDVNYAEVLAVLGQNPDYNWKNCNLTAFWDFISRPESRKYYYEMSVDYVVFRLVKTTIQVEKEINGVTQLVPEEIEVEEEVLRTASREAALAECKKHFFDNCNYKYYCDIKIKPFGLRGLYYLAEVDPNESHYDFKNISNLHMLVRNEYYIRTFARNAEYLLGPSMSEERSMDSTIYYDLLAYGPDLSEIERVYKVLFAQIGRPAEEIMPRGRSAWCYIEEPYNYNNITGEEPPEYLRNPFKRKPGITDPLIIDGNDILLDMLAYINQGWFPFDPRGNSGETIKQSGCMDCSIYMIIQYYMRENFTSDQIKAMSKAYVDSRGQFQTSTVLAQYGLKQGPNVNGYNNFVSGVISEIKAGRPALLHIRGRWTDSRTGEVYHSSGNGHFLVAVGYCERGVYVNDPGRQANNSIVIPWEEWANVSDLYYRPISPM